MRDGPRNDSLAPWVIFFLIVQHLSVQLLYSFLGSRNLGLEATEHRTLSIAVSKQCAQAVGTEH